MHSNADYDTLFSHEKYIIPTNQDHLIDKQKEFLNMSIITNKGKVIYLGFLFFLIFTIFNGLQNIITLLYTQLGFASLGAFTMLTIFASRAISNLFGPAFADKFAYNITFFVSSSSVLLFLAIGRVATVCAEHMNHEQVGCSDYFLYTLHFLAASLFGFFGSILWATQSSYVNECASVTNKGKLFGIFWSFMALSQISGNALTTVVLKENDASRLFDVYISIATIGIGLFMFVQTPEKPEAGEEDNGIVENKFAKNIDHQHLPIEDQCKVENDILDEASEKNNEVRPTTSSSPLQMKDSDSTVDPESDVIRFLKFFKHPKIISCLPLFLLQGYAFTIFITNMSLMVYQSLEEGAKNEKNQKVGIIFLVFGLSEVFAGQVFGYLFDKFKRYCVTLYCIINIACILSIYTAYVTSLYWVFIITAFLFALSDVGGETVIGGLLSLRFTQKVEPFVVFRCISTCGAALIMAVYMLLPNIDPLYMVVGTCGLIVGATWLTRNDLQEY